MRITRFFSTLIAMGTAVQVVYPTEAQSAEAAFPCEHDEIHNALDFMLGDWDIIVQGRKLAWIVLEKDARNCVVREQYGVPDYGHSGAGIDYWDAGDGIWRRILVTSVGTIETFEGERKDGKFIWNGREERADGSVVLERVEIWREDETVRNDIYQSQDGGTSWKLSGSEVRQLRTSKPSRD